VNFLLFLGFNGAVQAVSKLRENLQSELLFNTKTSDEWSGNVRFEVMHYFTNLPESPQLTYSQFLSARLSGQKEFNYLKTFLDISAGTFFSRAHSHFILHEGYGEAKTQNIELYLGRKKMNWSGLDRWAQLGLWQPKFAMDALRPEAQGLTGLFVQYESEYIQSMGFLSPLFLPSMGPEIREEDGGLVSDSRWYRAPSREFSFSENQPNVVQYKLDLNDVFRMLGSHGLGASLHLGKKDRGWGARFSSGFKPMNDLVLRRQIFKEVALDQVSVTVSPLVGYHSLNSMDIEYTGTQYSLGFSYLEDFPENELPDPNWSTQNLEGVKIYGAHIGFNIKNNLYENLNAELGIVKVNGGEIHDVLNTGERDEITIFSHRSFQFQNAAILKLDGILGRVYGNPLITRFKYIYDNEQSGNLLSAEFLYYPTSTWALVFGGDTLSSQSENLSDAFLNQFRANDRVYGGMTYVF